MPTPTFEYMTERYLGTLGDDDHTRYVNKIAEHGWRLIATDVTNNRMAEIAVMYFERPVEQADA